MKKVDTTSLVDQVYAILWQEIVQRNLKPKEKIDINLLAEKLEVSRTPVIDALIRLEMDGLVTRRNRVGTFVTPVNRSSFLASFQSREMIEQYITPIAINNIQSSDIEELQQLLDALTSLIDESSDESFDYASYTRYDNDFHIKLIKLGNNIQILEFYRSLNSHMQIARAYSHHALQRATEGLQEHRDILVAFVNGDVEQACYLQHVHLERSRAGVLKIIDEYGFL